MRSLESERVRPGRALAAVLVLAIPGTMLGGCTAMLLGDDVQPAQRQDQAEDDDKAKSKR